MIHIEKGKPWMFHPKCLCETFPENAATKILSGEYNFQIEMKMTLLDTSSGNGTIFCILPKYTGLDIHKNILFFTVKYEDESSKFYQFPFTISDGIHIHLKMIHVAKKYLKILINEEEQLNLNLENLGLYSCDNSCIVFGANRYTEIDENANLAEFHLYEFKLYEKANLLTHHTFDEFIFNKSVDKTGNLNFIHHKILEC